MPTMMCVIVKHKPKESIMADKTKNSSATPMATAVLDVRKHRLFWIIAAIVVVAGTSLLAGLAWYYKDRALPGVSVANIAVGGKTQEEIKAIATAQAHATQLTFEGNGQQTKASLADVGVVIDIDKTTDQALKAGRFWLDIIMPWKQHPIPLAYTSDLGQAKIFAKKHFPKIVTDAQDAQLVFNDQTKTYEVKDGTMGQGFDGAAFVAAVDHLMAQPAAVTLPVNTAPVEPVIKGEKLRPIKEQADKTLSLSIKFVHQGKLMYTASPPDIANWTHFVPKPTQSTVEVSYDTAKIKQFLEQKVAPTIATGPLDRKVVRDPNSGRETVIQSGREGRQLADVDNLVKDIVGALNKKAGLEKEVAVTTAPFKTVTLAGSDRWIEVDLSEQRTSLYLGADRIASFTISSGVASWPTVVGEFAIRYKTPNQVMSGGSRATGDYYYLPNVTWVSYFYRDYAFHTAYWHNNFGRPMSHGCINMRYDDAKALYDFAPSGTKVIVHH